MQQTRSYRDPHSKRFAATEAKIIPCVFIEMGGNLRRPTPFELKYFSIKVKALTNQVLEIKSLNDTKF